MRQIQRTHTHTVTLLCYLKMHWFLNWMWDTVSFAPIDMWMYHTGRFTFSTWYKLKYKEAAWGHIGRICQSQHRQDRKVIMVCTRNDCKIWVVFIQTWMEPLVLRRPTTSMCLTQHVGESRRDGTEWNKCLVELKERFKSSFHSVTMLNFPDGLIQSRSRDKLQFDKVTWPESDHVCVMWLSHRSAIVKTTYVSWEP